MMVADAEKIIEAAFPKQGVRLEHTPKGSFKVIKASGEVIGAAFDLTEALKQACRPILKAEAQRRIEEADEKTALFIDFQKFLMEKHNDEFTAWRETKAVNAPSIAAGSESDEKRLVSIVP